MKFLNLPKSKQFRIVTRFYDPLQEGLQERMNNDLAHNNGGRVSYGAGIKGKFRSAGKRINSKTGEEARRKSNMRLVYMLIILGALFYFFLK